MQADHRSPPAREQIGAIGGVAAGYSIVEPVRQYAEQEDILRHIAITKGLSGNAAELEIQRLNKLINDDARESGQTNRSVAEAYLDLQGQGIPTSMIDKVIRQHSMAATAYNISPEVLGPAVGALINSFQVPEDQIGSTLAAMAGASKAGRFKINDFATQLPGVAASFSSAGIKGREGAIMSFAALETVMKNVGEPGQAATSLNEVLSNIFSPFAERFFAKQGIDLGGMLRAAEKQGVDPLTAVLEKLQALTAGRTNVETKQIIGALVHDDTARKALIALLQHKDDYLGLRKTLGGASQATLQGDFSTEAAGPEFQMKMFDVNTQILGQELGKSFMPVMKLVNMGLGALTDGFTWLNEKMPLTTSIVLSVTGTIVLLGGALGVVSMALPAVTAGFSLLWAGLVALLSPIKWVWTALRFVVFLIASLFEISVGAAAGIAALAAVFVAAAVDIYENWGQFKSFFVDIWDGVTDIFGGVTGYLTGVFTLDFIQMRIGLEQAWLGIEEFFRGSWGIVETLFTHFTDWVDSWTGGAMSSAIGGIKDAWNGLKTFFVDLWKEIFAPFDNFVANFDKRMHKLGANLVDPTAPQGDDPRLPGGDSPVVPVPAPGSQLLQFQHEHVWKNGQVSSTTSGDSQVNLPTAAPLSPGRVLGRE